MSQFIYVVGFFQEVESALKEELPEYHASKTIIWIPQHGINQPGDLNHFKSHLRGLPDAGHTDLLVILAKLRKSDWMENAVQHILDSAKQRFESLSWQVAVENKARQVGPIVNHIRQFCPEAPIPSSTSLGQLLNGRRILCVRANWQPTFKETFRRQGLPEHVFDRFFEERSLGEGTHSNLNEQLIDASKSFTDLLYAFEGLRHLSTGTKRKYNRRMINHSKVTGVVMAFLQRINKNLKS